MPRTPKTEPDLAVAVTLDGVVYTVEMLEVSAMDAAALRRATGFSLQSLIQAAAKDPDIDVVAAIVWLARRAREKDLSFDTVAGEITYGSDIEFAEPETADLSDPET